jgi:hypothetical protein
MGVGTPANNYRKYIYLFVFAETMSRKQTSDSLARAVDKQWGNLLGRRRNLPNNERVGFRLASDFVMVGFRLLPTA